MKRFSQRGMVLLMALTILCWCISGYAAIADAQSVIAQLRQQSGYNVIGTVTVDLTGKKSVRVCPTPQDCPNDHLLVGMANPGEKYDCISVTDNGWYEIIYPTGYTGFINSAKSRLDMGMLSDGSYSYPIGMIYITHKNNVNIYNAPSSSSTRRGEAKSGERYAFVGMTGNGWYAILINTWVCYINPMFVMEQSRVTPSGNTPAPTPDAGSVSGVLTLKWVWADNNNADGNRPSTVEVTLMSRDGSSEVGSRQILSTAGGWQCVWLASALSGYSLSDSYNIGVLSTLDGYTLASANSGSAVTVTASRNQSTGGVIVIPGGSSGNSGSSASGNSSVGTAGQMTFTPFTWSEARPVQQKKRIHAHVGPGEDFGDGASYYAQDMQKLYAFFLEEYNGATWVYMDLKAGPYHRRLYFELKDMMLPMTLEYRTLSGYSAELVSDTLPLFGPGVDYDEYKNGKATRGTELTVLFEEGGYAFAQYICAKGLVRAWIPLSHIKAK